MHLSTACTHKLNILGTKSSRNVIKMLVGRKSDTGADTGAGACCDYGRETKDKKYLIDKK